ncbi:MAG: hypothetical protein Q7V88_04490 [Actinomycetota bacterium]|nr:hypothetical protein [Actinomycetota bacterium]
MRRALSLLLVALALTACKVDTTVDVIVQPDGSGTITVTAVADAELVAQAPGLAEDLRFDDAVAAGWVLTPPAATDAGGLQVVLAHQFATVEEATALLASLNGPDGPLHDVVLSRVVTDDAVTTSLSGSVRVANGVDAFADPEVLAAIGGSPYADDIAATGLRPADIVTFTLTAALPGDATTSASGTAPITQPLSWSVPLDGTTADLATTAVLAQSKEAGGMWGTVSTVALIALVAWCVLSVAFIAFVAKARRDRARRRPSPSAR